MLQESWVFEPVTEWKNKHRHRAIVVFHDALPTSMFTVTTDSMVEGDETENT
jgi:hypothetical protein